MGFFITDVLHRQAFDLVQRHGGVAMQTLVLRRHFSCAILELPRRICINGLIFFSFPFCGEGLAEYLKSMPIAVKLKFMEQIVCDVICRKDGSPLPHRIAGSFL